MKKFLPFLFPFIAFCIVIFLAIRWYNSKTARDGKIPEFADDVKVEDVNQAQIDQIKNIAKDQKTVKLTGQGEVAGEVRYELKDGKVYFTVYANLSNPNPNTEYQVWFKQVDGTGTRKVFVLTEEKAGYMGSAAVPTTVLPLEVVVTEQSIGDTVMGGPLLLGTLPKE